MKYEIKTASPDYYDQVADLLSLLTRVLPVSTPSSLNGNVRDSNLDEKSGLGDADSRMYVAVEEYYDSMDMRQEKVIGTATVFFEPKAGGVAAHIEDVVVNPGYRNRGVGSVLVDKCVNEARRRKCYKVVLDCFGDFVPFYEARGFVQNGVCMRLALDSEGENGS